MSIFKKYNILILLDMSGCFFGGGRLGALLSRKVERAHAACAGQQRKGCPEQKAGMAGKGLSFPGQRKTPGPCRPQGAKALWQQAGTGARRDLYAPFSCLHRVKRA